MVNKFEFPNDSPEEEIKRILLKTGLTDYEVDFLMSCYKIEVIDKLIKGIEQKSESNSKH